MFTVPEQSPPHPLNLQNEDFGTAVRVTVELLLNGAVHVAPQFIPTGVEVTEPPRLEVAVTDRLYVATALLTAVHEASVWPVPDPTQVQFVELPAAGNAGDAGEAVPAEQNVSAPYEVTPEPYVVFAVPQTPFTTTTDLLAEQVPLDAPPFCPLQVQLTVAPCAGKAVVLGVPAEHCVSGAYAVTPEAYVLPFAVPQEPAIGRDKLNVVPGIHEDQCANIFLSAPEITFPVVGVVNEVSNLTTKFVVLVFPEVDVEQEMRFK